MRSLPLLRCLGPLLVLAACDHSAPLGDERHQTTVPRTPGLPTRLTYAAPGEFAPAWALDGSAILYTMTRSDTRVDFGVALDGDRCVAFLPPEGGQVYRQLCLVPPHSGRSRDMQEEPAPGPAGMVAFLRSSDPLDHLLPADTEIILADTLGRDVRRLQSLPTRASNGAWYHSASHLRWLDVSRLLYVAEHVSCTNECAETVYTPVGVVELTLPADPATAVVLPGTERTTSIAVGSEGELYLTLLDDSRIYRRAADGALDPVWDFGAGMVARDVVHHDGRLLAIAGGSVELVDDPFDEPDMGPGRIDRGGMLFAVDLESGRVTETGLGGMPLRRPALSPDGRRVVVEALGPGQPDLWLLDTPWPAATP